MKSNIQNNSLIIFIKKYFNLFNKYDFNQRRPFLNIYWMFKDISYPYPFRDKIEKEGISLEDIERELNDILSNDDFLRSCCGDNIYFLISIIDIIFFKDNPPLNIAKGHLDHLCHDFYDLIYNTGIYSKKVFVHIFNLNSSVNFDNSILGGYTLEIISPLSIPELIGEKSFLSSIHPIGGSHFFLTKEDDLPVEYIESYIISSWKEANRYIQLLQYISDEQICIDYATIYCSPYWLNLVRREGIFLHGKPLKPSTELSNIIKQYNITNEVVEKMIKWLKFYNLNEIQNKLDIEYFEKRKINIPKFRNTILLAGSYYESYPMRETLQDKFLTLIFSLETLYSTETESTYRRSTYTSTLLANHGPERAKIYNFLKKMIKKRSQLVHGKKSFNDLEITTNDICELASYVRKSITSFISLYLREKNHNEKRLRDKFIGLLEEIAIGAVKYEPFEKMKDLEILVNETLDNYGLI